MDKDHTSSTDSYFFAYFRDLPGALEQIRDAVRASRGIPIDFQAHSVIDTTVSKPMAPPPVASRTQSAPVMDQLPKSPSGFRIPSLLRPLQESLPRVRSMTPIGQTTPTTEGDEGDEYTHVAKRGSSTFMAVTTSPTGSVSPREPGPPPPEGRSSSPPRPALHTYPPSPSSSLKMADIVPPSSRDSGLWTVGVPSWLRMPSMPSIPSRRTLTNVLGGIRTGEPQSTIEGGSVSEVLSSNRGGDSRMSGGSSGPNDFGYFSILETPATTLDDESIEKFRSSFAFDEKETLLGGELLFFYQRSLVLTSLSFPRLHLPPSPCLWAPLRINKFLLLQEQRAIDYTNAGLCRLPYM